MSEGEGEGAKRGIIRACVQINGAQVGTADAPEARLDFDPVRPRQVGLRHVAHHRAGEPAPQDARKPAPQRQAQAIAREGEGKLNCLHN